MSLVEKAVAARIAIDQFGRMAQCRLKLCVDCTLFYDGGPRANAAALQAFYEHALQIIGSHIRYGSTGGSSRLKKVNKQMLNALPTWLDSATSEPDVYGLKLESGSTADDISDQALYFFDDLRSPGVIRLMLPVEFLGTDGASLRKLVLDVVPGFRLLSAYAGFAVNVALDYPSHFPDWAVHGLSRRFRGVDFTHPLYFASFMRRGIKSINWLTFINDAHVKQLGGCDSVAGMLSTPVSMQALPNACMLQAGPQPCLGDVSAGEELPYYHQVGRALHSLRFSDQVLRGFNGVGGQDNTRDWLARFDT